MIKVARARVGEPPASAGLGQGMLNYLGKVRLCKVLVKCPIYKDCLNVYVFSPELLKLTCAVVPYLECVKDNKSR